jgi:hypothetical protein
MRYAFAAAVILIVPCSGFGQGTASSFATIRLAGLPTVYVQDRAGQETAGTLVGLSESALTLNVNGTIRTFEAGQVRRVQRRGDSLRNGTLIGLGFGALAALLSGMADCPGSDISCPGQRVAIALVGTGFYTAVGAGIDAAITGRTLLWESSDAGTPPLAFRLSPRRLGVNASLRW